jgi:hypothetical protein
VLLVEDFLHGQESYPRPFPTFASQVDPNYAAPDNLEALIPPARNFSAANRVKHWLGAAPRIPQQSLPLVSVAGG